MLLIPVVWALVAVRPRRGDRPPDSWDPIPPPTRTDTVERPALRPRDRDTRY